MLPWSDLGRPLTLRNRRDGDEGEAASLHRPFDNPHDAVREHGTYGGQGKAVGCLPPTALLFGPPASANTSGASGANNDCSDDTGNRRSNDVDGRGSTRRTTLRLEPRCRL